MLSWLNRSGYRSDVSHAELQNWRAQSRTFASFAAFTAARMNLSDDLALPEQASGTLLTANAFGVLRRQPLVGRDFMTGDEHPGAEPVVILGYGIWKNRYGADPNVLGTTLRGINTDHLMTMRLELPETRYATPEARRAFFARLELQLATITGVESSAVTTGVPPFDGGERLLEIERSARTSDELGNVSTVTISHDSSRATSKRSNC